MDAKTMAQRMTDEEVQKRVDQYIQSRGLVRCDFDDSCDFCESPGSGTLVQLCQIPEDVTEANYYICGSCVKKKAMLHYCECCQAEVAPHQTICRHCFEMEAEYQKAGYK